MEFIYNNLINPNRDIMVSDPDQPELGEVPFNYFLKGYYRHHLKLSGMAGDRFDNKSKTICKVIKPTV